MHNVLLEKEAKKQNFTKGSLSPQQDVSLIIDCIVDRIPFLIVQNETNKYALDIQYMHSNKTVKQIIILIIYTVSSSTMKNSKQL